MYWVKFPLREVKTVTRASQVTARLGAALNGVTDVHKQFNVVHLIWKEMEALSHELLEEVTIGSPHSTE